MCSLKHTELTKQLQLQLTSLREEYQRALQQLKEAHTLIDKHVESNSRLQTSEVSHPIHYTVTNIVYGFGSLSS